MATELGRPEDLWHRAELIPTAGIKGSEEQERRATSALLAVMSAVKEFGRSVTKPLGAPAGTIETFVEVPFDLDGKRCSPDGLIRISRGKTRWTALVETKTSTNQLQAPQLENYLDIARNEGFDLVLTISNEIPPIFGVHPTPVDRRKLRNVRLHHYSWTWILTEAAVQKLHRGVADPDQGWILGELIRYLEHPKSGAMEFSDMGDPWVSVREAVRAGTLRSNDPGAANVAGSWDQLVRFACLRLGRELGTEVLPQLSREEQADQALRASRLLSSLERNGTLAGGLRIPDTVGPITVRGDIRARQVIASVDIDAPRTGQAKTRVGWLVRQLRDAPPTLRIDAHVAYQRGSTSALLKELRDDPNKLIEDRRKEIKKFTVTMFAPMGLKRGSGRGSFIQSVLDIIDAFYGSVVQNLKAWTPPAPRLKKAPESESGRETAPPANQVPSTPATLNPPQTADAELPPSSPATSDRVQRP